MSEENVEIVRQAWEAQQSRDNVAAFRLYARDIELHNAFGEVFRGLGSIPGVLPQSPRDHGLHRYGSRGVDRCR